MKIYYLWNFKPGETNKVPQKMLDNNKKYIYKFPRTQHIFNIGGATADDRILPSHSKVPGHDGKRGFGGTCFPKDTSSLRYEMKTTGMKPYVMNAIIERNEKVDRPEKDWKNNKGRAVIDN
mgnify:CR=1 FL=1